MGLPSWPHDYSRERLVRLEFQVEMQRKLAPFYSYYYYNHHHRQQQHHHQKIIRSSSSNNHDIPSVPGDCGFGPVRLTGSRNRDKGVEERRGLLDQRSRRSRSDRVSAKHVCHFNHTTHITCTTAGVLII